MNKKTLLKLSLLNLCLLSILKTISPTLASFESYDKVNNEFGVGNIEASIDENGFREVKDWNGSKKDKIVNIENTGNVDCLVRVAIIPRWKDNEEYVLLDTSKVELNFSQDMVGDINKVDLPTTKWLDGNDGYYYYMSVVKPNDSTVALLEFVNLKSDSDDSKYLEKTLSIDVKVEVVQATEIGTFQFEDKWLNLSDNTRDILREIVSKYNSTK